MLFDKTEGLIHWDFFGSSLSLPYSTDLWDKGIDFYTNFYRTHVSKVKGELWFYIEAGLIDEQKLNDRSESDLKENDPTILYKLKSELIFISGFMVTNSTNV